MGFETWGIGRWGVGFRLTLVAALGSESAFAVSGSLLSDEVSFGLPCAGTGLPHYTELHDIFSVSCLIRLSYCFAEGVSCLGRVAFEGVGISTSGLSPYRHNVTQ